MISQRLKQTGDTIIEVLIVITLLSFILGGAYVVVNRGTQEVRDAQERSEAVNIAKGQLELLRNAGSKTYQTTAGKTFCFKGDPAVLTPNNSINQGSLPALGSDDFSKYDCSISPQGGVTYYMAIDYTNASNTYDVHVRWDKIGGGNNETVLNYRMY